jgi:hypothetical protein
MHDARHYQPRPLCCEARARKREWRVGAGGRATRNGLETLARI